MFSMDSQVDCVEPVDLGSSSTNFNHYVPKVVFEKIPKIGQEFDSVEEAQNFYNEYAKVVGFSIRNYSSKRNKSDEIIRKEFVCYKEGIRNYGRSNASRRRRPETREGCKAKLTIVKPSSKQRFVVSQFNEAHSHVLTTPRKVHMLRSHRSILSAKKVLTEQFSVANVPIHQQISVSEVQAEDLENIGCIEKDFYNARRDEVKLYAGHDAQMLIEYFQAEKDEDPEFFSSTKFDAKNKLTHCFWADAVCRRSYHAFGDVVVLDTTYDTNRHGMIFASFVGVNNHSQCTLFACAFLSEETIESFSWLLQQLLIAMPAGAPKMIITDQDPAMTEAISKILPNTIHRFCMWHILSKFSEKLDSVKLKEHYPKFRDCIWNCENPEQFEDAWFRVLETSGMSGNDWLKGFYDIRTKWIPAYVNETFSAGMSSNQQAESRHSFFKNYVSEKNTLMDFVLRFTRALRQQRRQELFLDHKNINEQPLLKTMWQIEKKMSEVYTHNIFYKFQDELYQSMAYLVVVEQEIGDICMYKVTRAEISEGRARKVIENKTTDYVSCSCKKFESCGIICRHILATFSRIKLQQPLSSAYVLRRWTTGAKSLSEFSSVGDALVVQHDNILQKLASMIIDEACQSRERFELARETFESLHDKLKSLTLSK